MPGPANPLNITQPGVVVFDGVSAFLGRTLTPGTGISISNGNGIAGNPTISLAGGGVAVEHLTGNSGGQLNPDGSNNFNTLGTGSITIAGSGSSLTTQLTGLTNHALLIGAGTATITKATVGTNGQVLLGSTAADPAFATLTSSDSSITFTTGANTLSLQVAGGTTVGKTITGNTGGAISPSSGNWGLQGFSAVAGTTPVTVTGLGSTLTVLVQLAQASASSSSTRAGISSFNSTNFSVDAAGYVDLTSAGKGITTVGDVTSGNVAFDGTIGTTLTSTAVGFNILVTSTSAVAGGPVVIQAGTSTHSASAGGALTLTGGTSSTGNGGAVNINGGTVSGAGAGNGGAVTILAGAASNSGNGGDVNITAGQAGSTAGNSGSVNLIGGASVDGGGTGGNITFTGTTATGVGVGGNITGVCGTGGSTSGNGGAVSFTGGAGQVVGAGGGFTFLGGQGKGASQAGGSVSFTSGASVNSTPGSFSFLGGLSAGSNQNASDFTMATGRGSGSGTLGKTYIQGNAAGTAAGTTGQTRVNRLIINGSVTSLSSGVAATIATITNASNSGAGGQVFYTVEASDGTDFQNTSGMFNFSLVNKATVVTSNISNVIESSAVSAGTLVNVFSFSGASLQLTTTTSLIATTLRITYSIHSNSQQAVTVP